MENTKPITEVIDMSDIEIDEIEIDDVDAEEFEDGSLLATAAVIGVGALLGFAAAKGYDMAKDAIQNKLAARRAKKIIEEMDEIENPADEAE